MSDLISRLRSKGRYHNDTKDFQPDPLIKEAADEIDEVQR